MRSFSSLLATAAFAVAVAAAPAAAQTFGSSVPDNAVGPFGRDALSTDVIGAVAQTFVTPTGSPVLQSFTFFLGDYIGGTDLRLQANVFVFAMNHVVGPALFTSAERSGSGNQESPTDPFTFSGVNLLLTPGTMYALVLRASAGSPDGTNFVGTTMGDSFSFGQLFTSTGGSDAELAAAGAFTASGENTYGSDAAVRVTFGPAAVTATPEPGTLLLLASGLGGVAGFARRRRRA